MSCCDNHVVGVGGGGGGVGPAGPAATDVCGLVLNPTGNATIEASPGRCMDETYATLILSAGTLAADITVSGAGGLDTGSESSNTWYNIWLIDGASPVALLISASSTAPTMPAGYTLRRRIGVVRNDASSNFMDYFMKAFGNTRRYEYNEDRNSAPQRLLSSGSATTFTNVSATAVIPPTSELGIFEVQTNVDFEDANLRPDGSTDGGGTVFVKEQEQEVFEMSCPAQIIEYKNTPGGNISLDVIGFYESLCPEDLP